MGELVGNLPNNMLVLAVGLIPKQVGQDDPDV